MNDTFETLLDKKIGRVRLTVDMLPDYNPDLDWIGTYSNTPAEGAISTGRSGRDYEWFNPQPGLEEYAQQDFEYMEAYNKGEWMMTGIRARVFVDGREVGDSSLWGIEYAYYIEDYHLETMRDMAHCALIEARKFIRSLQPSK